MAEAKKFAIVRFTEEYDAPGIIPLSWLAADNCTCYYPEAKTDQMRERLIKDAVNPQNKAYKWQICKVHVMHLYSTFALARQNLKKAEETSDLDTESGLTEERPRRKIKKTNFLLPGEEAGDIAEIQNPVTRRPVQQQSSIVLPPFPESESFHAPVSGSSLFFPHSPFPSTDIFSDAPHVSSPTNPQSAQFVSATHFSTYNPPVTHTLTDISKSYCTPSRQESSVAKSLHLTKTSSSSAYAHSPPISIPFDSAPPSRATLHPPIQEDLQHSSHSAKEDRKWAAVLQWMSDISGRLEKIEERVEAIAQRNVPIAEDNDTSIFDLLPLKSFEDFEKLDDALKTSKSLKSKLIRVLKSVGGKNAHALLCNMMRRLLEDHVAEVYNLSGTSTKNAGRRAFAGTQLCNSVLEACRTVYKDATDHDMLKNIGDWLNQAHTRIVRSCRPVPNPSP